MVALTGMELAILRERLKKNEELPTMERSDFVFPGSGKTGHLVAPKRGWATIRARA
jgi:hypothetical protein